MHRADHRPPRHRHAQQGQARRDARAARALRRRGGLGGRIELAPSRRRPARPSRPMRASRRRPPRRHRALPAFADDSGLVVDALDGAPGIYSARWAGETKDFRHAMEKVEGMLRERDAFTPEQRKAHFVSVLCVAWPDGHVEEFEGRVDGTLVWPPRGEKGFGYDPMFLPDGFDLTFGEMSADAEARTAAQGPGAVAPRARVPQARGGVSCATAIARSDERRRPSASTCTGRSACRSARIATSTATCATPRSTRSATCAPSRAEIAATAERVPGRTVSTIFMGGGTPSLMQPATVGAILDAIGKHWAVAPDVEVTLEANPTSVEATRFRGLSRGRRQSRVARRAGARRCVAQGARPAAHRAGGARCGAIARTAFERYSFDLIYARPGQTPAAWRAELARAIDEAAEHLSLYQLTIEQDTPFAALHAAGKLVIPDDDNARALYDVTQEVCGRARLAGLRDLQSRAAGRRMPAQSRLLALSRICRHRARRARAARGRRRSATRPRPRSGPRPG